MRYYFDTMLDGELIPDTEGEEFETAELAIERARSGAAQYGADHIKVGAPLDHEETLVRTEFGEIIAQFTVRSALIAAATKA